MRRLLVLDDDMDVARIVARVGQSAGFETRITSEPEQFLEEVARWDPSHIALDLVMPRMDGVEVMRRLAEVGCRARLILTSGVGTRVLDAARRSASAYGLHVVGAAQKPFGAAQLRQLLTAAPEPRQASWEPDDAPHVRLEESHEALAAGAFTVAYQPKVDCRTSGLVGFEALARWQHPVAGPIKPTQFIPFVEANGLIDLLTTQIFDQAVRWASATLPDPSLSVSVNLSVMSLSDLGLADRLAATCTGAGVDPAQVVIELTETSAMRDPVAALDILTRLRMKGFHLALDDFGTGYSSLVQLARLPFSEIKIDQSFVAGLSRSRESRTIVNATIQLGHSLGLRVTAEGVEDRESFEVLGELGCDLAQGYYIAKPMAPGEIDGWRGQWAAVHVRRRGDDDAGR
jgi:EAL domain-containing protein (putative c-di-GMP-specific phosphodiesterase class I)/FixJ family two-component response regulator